MSTTFEVANGSTATGNSRFGRRGTVMAAVVAVLLACTLTASIAMYLDSRYGPIQNGSFGIYSQDLILQPDGSSHRFAESPAQTAQLVASLRNAGSHSVEITAIDRDDVVSDVRWSVLATVPGGYVSGLDTPWQNFPAEIPAHATIRLLITIHRPAYCQDGVSAANGNDLYSGSHRVHWKSLLGSHLTTIEDQLTSIDLC